MNVKVRLKRATCLVLAAVLFQMTTGLYFNPMPLVALAEEASQSENSSSMTIDNVMGILNGTYFQEYGLSNLPSANIALVKEQEEPAAIPKENRDKSTIAKTGSHSLSLRGYVGLSSAYFSGTSDDSNVLNALHTLDNSVINGLSDLGKDILSGLQHQYLIGHLHSLNAVTYDCKWDPTIEEVPIVPDLIIKNAGLASLYSGFWNVERNPNLKQYNSKKAYEILGYDILEKYSGYVVSSGKVHVNPEVVESADFINKDKDFTSGNVNLNGASIEFSKELEYKSEYINEFDNLTWSDAIQILLRATGHEEFTYQYFVVPTDTITVENSPAIKGLSNPTDVIGSDVYVYVSRSNPITYDVSSLSDSSYNIDYGVYDTYWRTAVNRGLVNVQDKDKLISVSDFYILAQKVMDLYGEPSITDKEAQLLLQVYGSEYPMYSNDLLTSAWVYLKAKGILTEELGLEDSITAEQALNIAYRIKDVNSRETFKDIQITYSVSEALQGVGFFPAEVTLASTGYQVNIEPGSESTWNAYFIPWSYISDDINLTSEDLQGTPIAMTGGSFKSFIQQYDPESGFDLSKLSEDSDYGILQVNNLGLTEYNGTDYLALQIEHKTYTQALYVVFISESTSGKLKVIHIPALSNFVGSKAVYDEGLINKPIADYAISNIGGGIYKWFDNTITDSGSHSQTNKYVLLSCVYDSAFDMKYINAPNKYLYTQVAIEDSEGNYTSRVVNISNIKASVFKKFITALVSCFIPMKAQAAPQTPKGTSNTDIFIKCVGDLGMSGYSSTDYRGQAKQLGNIIKDQLAPLEVDVSIDESHSYTVIHTSWVSKAGSISVDEAKQQLSNILKTNTNYNSRLAGVNNVGGNGESNSNQNNSTVSSGGSTSNNSSAGTNNSAANSSSNSNVSTALCSTSGTMLVSWDTLVKSLDVCALDGSTLGPKVLADGTYTFMTKNTTKGGANALVKVNPNRHTILIGTVLYVMPEDELLVYTDESSNLYFNYYVVEGIVSGNIVEITNMNATSRTIGSGTTSFYNVTDTITNSTESANFKIGAPYAVDTYSSNKIKVTTTVDGVSGTFVNLANTLPTSNWLLVVNKQSDEIYLFTYYNKHALDGPVKVGPTLSVEYKPSNAAMFYKDQLSTKVQDAPIGIYSSIQDLLHITVEELLATDYDNVNMLQTAIALADMYALTGSCVLEADCYCIGQSLGTQIQKPSVGTGKIYYSDSAGYFYSVPELTAEECGKYFTRDNLLPLVYNSKSASSKSLKDIYSCNIDYYGQTKFVIGSNAEQVLDVPYGYVLLADSTSPINTDRDKVAYLPYITLADLPNISNKKVLNWLTYKLRKGESDSAKVKLVKAFTTSGDRHFEPAPIGVQALFGGFQFEAIDVSAVTLNSLNNNKFLYGTLVVKNVNHSTSSGDVELELSHPDKVAKVSVSETDRFYIVGLDQDSFYLALFDPEIISTQIETVAVVDFTDAVNNGQFFNWKLGKFASFTNVMDNASTILIFILMKILPLILLMDVTVLVGLSFVTGSGPFLALSNKFDIIKFLTLGALSAENWDWHRVLIPCILVWIGCAMWYNGNVFIVYGKIVEFIQYIIEGLK